MNGRLEGAKNDHDLKFAQHEEMEQRKDLLKDSIKISNERERNSLFKKIE